MSWLTVKSPQTHRGTEVAVRESSEIVQVLRGKRPVEPVGAVEVGLDLGGQRLFLVERTARREPHQHERKRDDQK